MIECQNSSNTPEKHSVEYAIITENVSDAVQSIKSPYSFQNRCIQKTVKTFKMDCFSRKQCLSEVRNQIFFRAGGCGTRALR